MLLYKYANGESALKILQGLKLKVTPPNQFNDPFELTPRSRFTMNKQRVLKEIQEDPEQLRPVHESIMCDGYPYSFEQFVESFPVAFQHKYKAYRKLHLRSLVKQDLDDLDEASLMMGILCLSKVPDSIPMWSHYASQHEGVVLGFKDSAPWMHPVRLAGHFGEVKYRKHRLRVDRFIKHNRRLMEQVIATIYRKSLDWAYEKEYRRVFLLQDLTHVGGAYFLHINASDIQEIIFGCRIGEYEQKITAELDDCPNKFRHIKRLRCRRNHLRFAIDIIPVDQGKPAPQSSSSPPQV